MKVLVTGTAGFIGAAVAIALQRRGDFVVGIDEVNDYYDVGLKRARLQRVAELNCCELIEADLADREVVSKALAAHRPDHIVHLAAQAGVRYSLDNPRAYLRSNVDAFLNVLEGCREFGTEHLVYASSSSVYGANTRMPFSVHDTVDHPVSLYAATKKSNEMLAHTYSHLFGIACTGLRFFTVYGPWGRPDMSPFIFAKRILEGTPVDVFNHGRHRRDFTYIDDIVEGVIRVLDRPAVANPDWRSDAPDPASSSAPCRIYNIGNGRPVELMHYIRLIEEAAGRTAVLNMLPMQPGDVEATYAGVAELEAATGYRPTTTIEDGVRSFITWFKDYYGY